MRIPALIFAVLFFCSSAARAQSLPPLQSEQDPCGALALCGSTFNTPYSYTGYGQTQQMNQFPGGGCFDESNSVWLTLTVATAGTIAFTITPVIFSNDYDFAVYNTTTTGCGVTDATNRVRCNGAQGSGFGSPGGLTGLSPAGVGTVAPAGSNIPFLSVINGVPGEVYHIMIDNFNTSGVAGFTIDFSQSTATFVQAPLPAFASIEPACSYSLGLTVNTNVPVKCSSIAPNGSDFTITGGAGGAVNSATGVLCAGLSGYTQQIILTFSTPLPPGTYNLQGQVGTDGNTLLNLCDNALIPPSGIQFVVLPIGPPQFIKPDTPSCVALQVRLTKPIACRTVAPDGSDFTVAGPSAVQVIGAQPKSCIGGLTDTLEIFFAEPIAAPGVYTLGSQTGTDGNPLADTCGVALSGTTTWAVSDRGFVTATVTPNLLCSPGYVALNIALGTTPPPAVPTACGVATARTFTPALPHYTGNPGFGGTVTPTPFAGANSDVRTQLLFTAAELQAAGLGRGTIKSIALDVTAKNSTSAFANLTIKMGCTAQANLNSGTAIAGLATVWSNGATGHETDTGLNRFFLTAPYDWDGVSNLAVELCYDNQPADISASDAVRATPAFAGAMLQVIDFTNTGSGCALTDPGTSYSMRPNVIFYQSLPRPEAGSYGLAWAPGDYVADSTAANTSAYVDRNRQWEVTILDNRFCYRHDTTAVKISIRFPTIGPAADTAVCPGQSVPLQAGGGASYEWFPTTGLSCTTCDDPIATPEQTTTYYVSIIDQYGCADTLSRTIIIYPIPAVTAGPDTTIIYGQPIRLLGNSPGAQQLQWSPAGTVSDPSIIRPVANPGETTIYTLSVIDTNGCRNEDDVTITVRYTDPLNIPTAFTPNGDGVNDKFMVARAGIKKLTEFRIFDRWGREVFSTTNINDGWDGTYKGMPQDMGVYHFLIRAAWPDGKDETVTGDLTLVR